MAGSSNNFELLTHRATVHTAASLSLLSLYFLARAESRLATPESTRAAVCVCVLHWLWAGQSSRCTFRCAHVLMLLFSFFSSFKYKTLTRTNGQV